jgi:DNA-binding MarR family transcriptional regulator
MVDGLVGRGLIERRYDHDDRRTVALELTPAGRKVLGEADEAVEARLRDLADCRTDDGEQALEDLCLWQPAMVIHRQRRGTAR